MMSYSAFSPLPAGELGGGGGVGAFQFGGWIRCENPRSYSSTEIPQSYSPKFRENSAYELQLNSA
jgi:hypothetical protein